MARLAVVTGGSGGIGLACGQLLVENGTLFGELPAGGYDQITDNPLAQGRDDDALDRAAMESGTD